MNEVRREVFGETFWPNLLAASAPFATFATLLARRSGRAGHAQPIARSAAEAHLIKLRNEGRIE